MSKRFANLRWLAAACLTGLVFAGAGCGGNDTAAATAAATPITIKVWGVFDDQSAWSKVFANYQKIHPNVSFTYRGFRSDEYQNELLKGFAQGTGPDIFAVHNTGVKQDLTFLAPMPASVSIPYTTTTGTINKQKVSSFKPTVMPTLTQLQNQYIDVVASDVVQFGNGTQHIYGLPISMDTLVMFYNRDLLNAANIAEPPATWDDFQKVDVPKLTTLGANNVVIQSGAALGTSQNVERAFDIVSLLMMQNGTTMTNAGGSAEFANQNQQGVSPGSQALQFYTGFANPATAAYTWNAKEPASFDAFANGQTAFFFGYSYHIPLLRARNPKLRFGIAAVPQIASAQAVNYANYWIEGVAKSSKNQTWDWDFINFAAQPAQVKVYITDADHPPALKSMIASYTQDPDLGVFAGQLLTAKSWYHGSDPDVTEKAFLDLIDAVNAGGDIGQALNNAQNKVNQTL